MNTAAGLPGIAFPRKEAAKLREQSRTFSYRPLISILTPTFNPNDGISDGRDRIGHCAGLRKLGLILIDDGSSDSSARALLKNLGQRDARIQIASKSTVESPQP
jgi:hypothetical protein